MARGKTVEPPPNKLTWKKRSRHVNDPAGDFHRQIWETVCGRYRVVLATTTLGQKYDAPLPDCWYAMWRKPILSGFCWTILSRHRKRGPAETVCVRHSNLERKGVSR